MNSVDYRSLCLYHRVYNLLLELGPRVPISWMVFLLTGAIRHAQDIMNMTFTDEDGHVLFMCYSMSCHEV